MSKWEEKLRDWIMRHVLWLAWAAALALGVFLRWSYLPNLAADLEFMNAGWYNAIREGGMKAALAPGTPVYLQPAASVSVAAGKPAAARRFHLYRAKGVQPAV